MANTGNKQAAVAYKVRNTDGAPLDIDGKPTSESGKRQAIALLRGASNPNPLLFEVQFYYDPDAAIAGVPTVEYAPEECGTGFIQVSPSRQVFEPESAEHYITVTSSHNWNISSVDTEIVGLFNVNPTSGGKGITEVKYTLADPLREAQGFMVYKNLITGDTAKLKLINVLNRRWILETGNWDDLGFWDNSGIWNY